MNILLLNGSPRKKQSNTLKLTNAFLDCLILSESNQVNQIDLYDSDLEINHCIGCFSCWTKTPGKCILNDNMTLLLEKVKESDMIIWSFPVYYFDIPSKMKAFMDRLLPLNLPFMTEGSAGHVQRYDLSHQKQIVIASGGLSTVENNFEALEKHFDLLNKNHKSDITTIFVAQSPLLSVPQLQTHTTLLLDKFRTAGQEYASSFSLTMETKQLLEQPMFAIDIYNEMADTSWNMTPKNTNESSSKKTLLNFTKQMALLYSPQSYKRDIVLELEYTDRHESYQILLKKDKAYVIDYDFKPYTTKIETSFAIWSSISSGERSGPEALMNGDYKVLGDLSVMMQWENLFSAGIKNPIALNQSEPKQKEPSKTSMNMMLIPLISMWIALSINMRYGALISIIIAGLLPVVFFKIRLTIYDKIATFGSVLFSALALFGVSYSIILPVSYALFAMMWLGSLLTKIPLSAHYSNVDFGGESAFQNPIFMKTNRILTAAWGVLYILITIMSIFFIRIQINSVLITVLNNILPLLMGIFTNWFKDWHPQHLMKSN